MFFKMCIWTLCSWILSSILPLAVWVSLSVLNSTLQVMLKGSIKGALAGDRLLTRSRVLSIRHDFNGRIVAVWAVQPSVQVDGANANSLKCNWTTKFKNETCLFGVFLPRVSCMESKFPSFLLQELRELLESQYVAPWGLLALRCNPDRKWPWDIWALSLFSISLEEGNNTTVSEPRVSVEAN